MYELIILIVEESNLSNLTKTIGVDKGYPILSVKLLIRFYDLLF